MRLEFISIIDYLKEGYPEKALLDFDCGVISFNDFIHTDYKKWQEKLSGVTYLLIDKDEDKEKIRVYSFATVSTIGLLDSTIEDEAYYVSGIEIKLFAIDKAFRKQTDSEGIK